MQDMSSAMILAAGFGTRMRPLTGLRPKCLMPVMNRPLLGHWLERLSAWGIRRAVVNTHHLAGQVADFMVQNRLSGMEVIQSHEPEILGTGGGLAAAREKLGPQPFLSVSADVLFAANAMELFDYQAKTGAVAVLALVDDARFNTVAMDGERVLGFKGDAGLDDAPLWLNYANAGVFDPALLDYLPQRGFSNLTDALRAAIRDGRKVLGMGISGWWENLGSPAQLWELHRDLIASPPKGMEHLQPASPVVLGPGAVVEPGARVEGFAVLGAGCLIESGAYVKDCLLMDGARVLKGAKVKGAVLGDGYRATGQIEGGAHV